MNKSNNYLFTVVIKSASMRENQDRVIHQILRFSLGSCRIACQSCCSPSLAIFPVLSQTELSQEKDLRRSQQLESYRREKTHILAFCCQTWPELSRPGLHQTPEDVSWDVAPVAADPLSSEERGSMDQTGISRKNNSVQ